MPRYYKRRYKRRPKRTMRRKRYGNFRRRFKGLTRMRSTSMIAPDTAFTKLKYTDIAYISGATNLPSPNATLATNFTNSRLIRGNDVYDPKSSSGTGSVTGFNQWCAQEGLYQEFIVHGSKIKVEVANVDGNATNALLCTLYPLMENNATLINIDGQNQAYVRTQFVGGASGSSKAVLKNFMKTKKLTGVKDLVDDEQNKGSYNASPNALNLWDWALDVVSLGSSATPAIAIRKEVTYYVQFLQRPLVQVSTQ